MDERIQTYPVDEPTPAEAAAEHAQTRPDLAGEDAALLVDQVDEDLGDDGQAGAEAAEDIAGEHADS